MKKTFIICMAGTVAFAAPFVNAEPATASVATEASADSTISAYVLKIKGAGWGAAKKARVAISTQPGIKNVMLSGLRATVFMEGSNELSRAKVSKALKERGLQLRGFDKTELPVPKAGYMLNVSGTGWADTNDKAREALEKIDGITGAYVNMGISVFTSNTKPLDEAKLKQVLAKHKMSLKGVSKMSRLPF